MYVDRSLIFNNICLHLVYFYCSKREPRSNRFSVIRTVSVVGQQQQQQQQPQQLFISGGRSPPIQPLFVSGSHSPQQPQQLFFAGGHSPPSKQLMTPMFSPPQQPAGFSFAPMPQPTPMQPLRPMFSPQQPEMMAYRQQMGPSYPRPNSYPGSQGYNSMPPPMPYYQM